MSYIVFLWWIVCALLLATPIHEAGHAFFGRIVGMRPNDFTPYPHMRWKDMYCGYVAFKKSASSKKREALMHLGSLIFQVISFGLCIFFLVLLKKSGTPMFLVGLLWSYAILSLLDWPIYVFSSALKLPHFFFFGAPWRDSDPYLFAKTLGIEKKYWIVCMATFVILLSEILVAYFVFWK